MEIDDPIGDAVSDAEALAAPSIRGGLNPSAARLFRVYRTMANMLDKRGYMVPKNLRDMTPNDFKRQFGEYPARDALTVLVEKADDEKNQLFVFYPEDEKLGVKPIKVRALITDLFLEYCLIATVLLAVSMQLASLRILPHRQKHISHDLKSLLVFAGRSSDFHSADIHGSHACGRRDQRHYCIACGHYSLCQAGRSGNE